MARETDSYRDILADLYEFFGDKRLLTKHEVSRYLGKDPRTVENASAGAGYTKRYTSTDAVMMARVMFLEARGIKSKTEIACIGWTILNRVDAGYGSIQKVITAPNQFAYRASASTTSDYGYDLVALATDVLDRWSKEKAGQAAVGRVLPKGYLWYAGDGKHNYFRNQYKGGTRWTYSLPSPYES